MQNLEKDHKSLWNVIDKIAYINGISVSLLAKNAGLDGTAFNKSKRFYLSGKCRWLSMRTISKILEVSDMELGDFCEYMYEEEQR
ncbi:MAG: hypothetical protein ACI4N3_01345 [Alphaproteobacteria bacterium]